MFNRDAKETMAAQSGVMDAQKQLIAVLQQELAAAKEKHAACMAQWDREIAKARAQLNEARAEVKAAELLFETLGIDVDRWRLQRSDDAMWWHRVLSGLSANIEYSIDLQMLPAGEAGKKQAVHLTTLAKSVIPQIKIND